MAYFIDFNDNAISPGKALRRRAVPLRFIATGELGLSTTRDSFSKSKSARRQTKDVHFSIWTRIGMTTFRWFRKQIWSPVPGVSM